MKIGITGGIGSGKSVVMRILENLQYPVFYSDACAKRLIDKEEPLRAQIVELLGTKAFYNSGTYNVAYVAQRVFDEPSLRTELNKLIHPLVRAAFETFADQHPQQLVFNEAAILFETGAHKNFDACLLVTAPMHLRLQRIQARDGSDVESIRKRMESQWSDAKKAELADALIVNDEQQSILLQLKSALEKFQEKAKLK